MRDKFIRLTQKFSGKQVYIQLCNIDTVSEDLDGDTEVCTSGGWSYTITEDPQYIVGGM